MNLMNVRGSLTAWAGGPEPRRRRRPPGDAWGDTTSSVAAAIARRTLGSAGGVASLTASAAFPRAFRPSSRARPGGGTAGTGMGWEASLEPIRTRVRLPPTRRDVANSQSCSPWNSWNESLDSTVAPVFSAMRRRKASPLPMAPAGGETISPWASASSNAWRSDSSILCPNEASTTTVTSASGNSRWNSRTASSSWARVGTERPSVAMLDPSTTTRRYAISCSQPPGGGAVGDRGTAGSVPLGE